VQEHRDEPVEADQGGQLEEPGRPERLDGIGVLRVGQGAAVEEPTGGTGDRRLFRVVEVRLPALADEPATTSTGRSMRISLETSTGIVSSDSGWPA
jgi:hypothetical protein